MNDESMEYSGDAKKSKYNAAIAQLYRLDNLWQLSHEHSRNGDLLKWNWDLDKVYAELAGDTEPNDDVKFSVFNKLIFKYKNNRSFLYRILLQKEIFLRRLQNKQGKGTAYIDPEEDLLEED